MKKTTILIIFNLFFVNLIVAQWVEYNFNTTPFLNSSYTDSHITASDISLSTGTIDTDVTVGEYFINEPYIEETGGWTATSYDDAKNFYVELVADAGYEFSITNISFEAYATGAGPSALSLLLNDTHELTMDMPEASLVTISQDLTSYNNLTNIIIKIAGWNNGSRSSTGNGDLRLDQLEIQGTSSALPANDSSSLVQLIQGSTPENISSISDSIAVFEIAFTDSASGDGLNTFVDSIVFTPNAHNEFSNWDQIIDSAKLIGSALNDALTGSISDDSIVFNTASIIEIADGSSSSVALYLYLNDTLTDSDNKQFGIYTDSTLIVSNSLGSCINHGQLSTEVNELVINIDATKLITSTPAQTIPKNTEFSMTFQASDKFGNMDEDFTESATLSAITNEATLSSSAGLINNFVKGEAVFNNLNFDITDTVQLTLSSATLENYLSDTILVVKNLFQDDFEDASLDKWSNTSDWEINSTEPIEGVYSLKHNIENPLGESYISSTVPETEINTETMVWRLALSNGNFNPSSSNGFWYYLMASTDSLTDSEIDGYALGVNLSGKTNLLSLWRVDNDGDKTLLIESDFLWAENTTLFIEATRDGSGVWQLSYCDNTLYSNKTYSSIVTDNTHLDNTHHGLVFNFSSTRTGLLKADEISIFSLNNPPKVLAVYPVSKSEIKVEFSEPINADDAINTAYYSLTSANDANIKIDSLTYDANQPTISTLYVNELIATTYNLTIENIRDIENKTMPISHFEFDYVDSPEKNDIVINEIMIDPSPTIGLPEYEYIELYNRSTKTINTEGWQLQVNDNIKTIESFDIEPDSYIILCSTGALSELEPFATCSAVSGFPSLTNASGTITILDSAENIINTISYSDSWYNDDEKDDGGWSLEMIDSDNVCSTAFNWKASVDTKGGTPGQVNAVNAVNLDETSPEIESLIPLTNNQIWILFSEEIPTAIISSSSHYTMSINNETKPASVTTSAEENLVLSSDQYFAINDKISISITNISDNCGNLMNDTTISFVYYEANLYDVVINEIMFTPAPTIALPEAEYIELYNNSMHDIFLYNWEITISSSTRDIPYSLLPANSYAILCADEYEDLLTQYGQVIAVDDLPALPASSSIYISDAEAKTICLSTYTKDWISDDFKADGGYSLERIDFNNPSENEENWQVSDDADGGTPGYINSVYENNPDTEPFNLVRAYPIGKQSIQVEFNKTFAFDSTQAGVFEIDDDNIDISQVETTPPNYNSILIELNAELEENITYTLSINEELTDLSGNTIDNRSDKFMLASYANPSDIIINEILFDANDDGADFVELYNNSNKAFGLSQFILASRNDEDELKSPYQLENDIILPAEYRVITLNSQAVKEQYYIENEFAFIDHDKLPSLSSSEGIVVLLDTLGIVIDELAYSEDMHFGLLEDPQGISLERISFTKDIWHSASEASGWATPGYQNSVFDDLQSTNNDEISVSPEAFSPDNDGYNDILHIEYNFSEPGKVANVSIINKNGYTIRKLVNNELIAQNGSFIWDGLTDEQQKAPIGIYIIFIEVFNENGEVQHIKKTCVVATRF